MKVTETKCEVDLKNLLSHSLKRLLQYLNLKFDQPVTKKLVFLGKYGFDGTNANVYKQKAEDKNAKFNSIFCSSFVPLKLYDIESNFVYWENISSSSQRLCRPIKIMFEKKNGCFMYRRRRRYEKANFRAKKLWNYRMLNILRFKAYDNRWQGVYMANHFLNCLGKSLG